MADQDTTVHVENGETTDEEVETVHSEDETSQEDNQEDVTDTGKEDDASEPEDGKDTKTEEKEKVEFKKRFTQLMGETPEEYMKNLEDAYANSSTEGQRLAQRTKEAESKVQQIAKLVATNPEFAKLLSEVTGEEAPKLVEDPALVWAKQEMEKQYASDWKSFTDKHPDVATDKDMQQALINEIDAIGLAYEKRGINLSLAEGLNKAWVSLGYNERDSKEDVLIKAKEHASQGSQKAKKTKATQSEEFTTEQIAVAKKFGLSAEQLAEYNK